MPNKWLERILMKATVLLFNINEKERLREINRVLFPLGYRIRTVKKEDYLQLMGYLVGIKTINPVESSYEGEELADEMLLMAGMGSRDVDNLITAFRKAKLTPISCKAVLTETNQYWNALQLFEELVKEREAMQKPME